MMTFYSIETGSRKYIYFYSAAVSIITGSIIAFLDKYIDCKAIAPSSLMIFAGVIALYNGYLWKYGLFVKTTDIPNISGLWRGELRRTVKTEEQVVPVSLIINQTWTKIDLILESPQTVSETISATMFVENTERVRLVWTYAVRSRSMLEKQNLYGEGVTDLRLSIYPNGRKLEGTYFSSKLRKGHLILSAQ